MSVYLLGIGSNIEPEKNVPMCLKLLREYFTLSEVSSIYETPPFGEAAGGTFWNLAVKIESEADALTVVSKLKQLETRLGRVRVPGDKYAARTIDLDLLPQAGCEKQPFTMIPLAEIDPDGIDPKTGKTFSEIAGSFAEEKKLFRKII